MTKIGFLIPVFQLFFLVKLILHSHKNVHFIVRILISLYVLFFFSSLQPKHTVKMLIPSLTQTMGWLDGHNPHILFISTLQLITIKSLWWPGEKHSYIYPWSVNVKSRLTVWSKWLFSSRIHWSNLAPWQRAQPQNFKNNKLKLERHSI